jgi:hypothetical protein
MRRGNLILLLLPLLAPGAARCREIHVSVQGSDRNDGSAARPYRTISAAAQAAQPGDVVTVHAGTYRERVTPPRGGESDERRIVYQAAPGEEAVITGSEAIRGWKPFRGEVWKVRIPNTFFGKYNPYRDAIAGDWFNAKGRLHHTGEVYLDGKPLWEAAILEGVLDPQPAADAADAEGSTYTWFAEVDAKNTYLYANFHGRDPNREAVEINVRDSCFYPDQPGRDYITVRGFRMMHAATQWAAPTAEQIGLIGTHWSKGWIIENNVVSDSKCACITLGKDRKSGHNVWTADPRKDGATHYNEVILRALAEGWARETIGSHVVRNNTIYRCGQAGIAGSLGAAFSEIYDNHIYDIWTRHEFGGAEMAGIKLHGAIDVVIRHNRIHNAGTYGMWMDWMAQGTRITGNLLYGNYAEDLFFEVDHGPYLVDDNLLLSRQSLRDWSEGGAYVQNLFAGRIVSSPQAVRSTPYMKAHSTAIAGLSSDPGGDDRFYNNIFVGNGGPPAAGSVADADPLRFGGYGLWVYNHREFPLAAGGNVYFHGARPYFREEDALLLPADPAPEVEEQGSRVYLHLRLGPEFAGAAGKPVSTQTLGKARIPGLGYEHPDGSPLAIDTDYLGRKRGAAPAPGPFANPGTGSLRIEVW